VSDNSENRAIFLVFNHKITPEQKKGAEISLGVNRIIEMPENLQLLWQQIPPALPGIKTILDPVKTWLVESAKPLDYVLIQGDFGATYLLVEFALNRKLIPVYSTTIRQARESIQPDGSLKTEHLFKHKIFRRYGC